MSDTHLPQRVRHEIVRRELTVVSKATLSPGFVRVTLAGDALAGFTSLGFDDHIKCFFPTAAEPVARDFTPRRFDPQRLELDLEFALHGQGPADAWARAAQVGSPLLIAGPRGSMVIPMDFDGYLLVGDATAWPAIARRLTELPAAAPVRVIVDLDDPADQQPVVSAAAVEVEWLQGPRTSAADRLSAAIAAVPLPAGDVHAWAAGETLAMREVRAALLARGLPKAWIKVAGYWRNGASGVHDTIDD